MIQRINKRVEAIVLLYVMLASELFMTIFKLVIIAPLLTIGAFFMNDSKFYESAKVFLDDETEDKEDE